MSAYGPAQNHICGQHCHECHMTTGLGVVGALAGGGWAAIDNGVLCVKPPRCRLGFDILPLGITIITS